MELLLALLAANDILSDKYVKVLEALLALLTGEKRNTEKKLDELGKKVDRNYAALNMLGEKVDRNYAALNMLYAQFGDFLISYYDEATERLEDALYSTTSKDRREKLIEEARQKFEEASSKTNRAFPLISAKAQLGIGTCYELLNERGLAKRHYAKAYEVAESDKNYTYMKMVCNRLYLIYNSIHSYFNKNINRIDFGDTPATIKSNLQLFQFSFVIDTHEVTDRMSRMSENDKLKFGQSYEDASEVIDFLWLLAPALILRNIDIPVETLVEIEETGGQSLILLPGLGVIGSDSRRG